MCSSSFADSHGDTKNGIGSQIIFVISVIHFQHHIIDFFLVGRIHISFNQCWSNNIVYIIDSFGYAFSMPFVLILVSEFKSFINTCKNIEKKTFTCNYSLFKNNHFFQKKQYEEMGKMPDLSCDVILDSNYEIMYR